MYLVFNPLRTSIYFIFKSTVNFEVVVVQRNIKVCARPSANARNRPIKGSIFIKNFGCPQVKNFRGQVLKLRAESWFLMHIPPFSACGGNSSEIFERVGMHPNASRRIRTHPNIVTFPTNSISAGPKALLFPKFH